MVGTSMFISFVIVFLSLNSITFGIFYSWPSYVAMKPDDPIVIEFDTIVLNCTLMPQYNGTCSARDLFIRHSSMDFKYPDIQAITNKTAQFRLPNATVENNGRFSCELSPTCNGNVSVGFHNAQYVHVKKNPLMPYLIGCTVENWEFLVCSWGPNVSTQSGHMSSQPKAVKQQLLWQHPGDGDNWTECPESTASPSEICFWRSSRFTMKKEYCIKIVVWSTKSSNVSSVVECLNPELIVKPKPATIIQSNSTEDGKMLSIEWRAPPTIEKVPLTYRVVVHSKWEDRNFTVVNDTWINVSTVPYTKYSISIVAFPSERGFPSDTALTTLLSASAVPSENAFVMTNFYSVNIADRMLVLYWQPILEKNYCGPEFHYYVINRTLPSSSEYPRCDSSCYSTVMTWNGFTSDLLIVSRNKIGSALPPSLTIHVPSNDQLLFDIEVIAEGQDKNVSVDWVVKKTSEREIESVMLFWCQPLNFHQTCKTPIQWQTINDMSLRDFNLTFDEEYKNFQFGASVKFSGGDYSGIQWSRRRYSLTKMPGAPEGLKVSAPPGRHSELQVSWKEPRYSDSSACVRSFAIFYCPVNYRNQCISENQSEVILKYQDHLRISDDGDGSYILKGLDPYATYRIWMTSNSRQGSSKPSESVYGGTHQPWFTPGKIVGIVAGVLLASMVVIFGLYVTFRCCDKYRKKLTSGFKVSLPQRRFQLSSTSSEAPVLKSQTEVQYWRQPSQVSTGSHDSGHYSFPPSSPAMLPLLLEGNDKLKDHMDVKRGRNCYQPTNFTGVETIEDDEGSDGSALDITTYKIVPNVGIDVKPQANQTQYVLPEEINWMEGGTMAVNVDDCLASDTKDGKVDYCNDFHFPNASDFSDIGYTKIEQIPTTVVSIPSNGFSDIGYTKIEQIPTTVASIPSNQPESCRNATDSRNEDSNLLFCFDHQPGELDSSSTQSVPLVNHLDELLATLSEGQSLTDDILVSTEALAVNDSCPISATETSEEELPLYSKQALGGAELNFLNPIIQGTGFHSGNNGYLPHNLLLSID